MQLLKKLYDINKGTSCLPWNIQILGAWSLLNNLPSPTLHHPEIIRPGITLPGTAALNHLLRGACSAPKTSHVTLLRKILYISRQSVKLISFRQNEGLLHPNCGNQLFICLLNINEDSRNMLHNEHQKMDNLSSGLFTWCCWETLAVYLLPPPQRPGSIPMHMRCLGIQSQGPSLHERQLSKSPVLLGFSVLKTTQHWSQTGRDMQRVARLTERALEWNLGELGTIPNSATATKEVYGQVA